MSDLEMFTAMLERAGAEFSVWENETFKFRPKYPRGSEPLTTPTTMVQVSGTFYDELQAFFDPETGDLLEMQSHVAFSEPEFKAMQTRLGWSR